MGRLNKGKLIKQARRSWPLFKSWLAPVGLTLIILFGIHAGVKADPAPPTSELQAYLQDNQLNLFDDSSTGLPQVYYFFNHKPVQLTHGNFGALHPVASGQYVAYLGVINGLTQLFLYDVLSDSIVQLSITAPNEGISISGNHLAWQTWDGSHWQIDYYDGQSVQQITSGDLDSINASTNGTKVLFATLTGPNEWTAEEYDPASGQTTAVRQGDVASTAYPRFNDDGSISTEFVPY